MYLKFVLLGAFLSLVHSADIKCYGCNKEKEFCASQAVCPAGNKQCWYMKIEGHHELDIRVSAGCGNNTGIPGLATWDNAEKDSKNCQKIPKEFKLPIGEIKAICVCEGKDFCNAATSTTSILILSLGLAIFVALFK